MDKRPSLYKLRQMEHIVTVVYLAEIWIHVFHIRLVIAK